MKKRRTSEGRQSNTLQDLGLGASAPSGEFSDQPDSSGRIGGTRGVDEFGIEGGAAVEWSIESVSKVSAGGELVERTQAGVEGIDEYSVEGEIESEEIVDELEEQILEPEIPSDLRALIEYRLQHHDRIDAGAVSVRVEPPGLVMLSGRVRSESESMRVSEIVSALPGVYAIRNRLEVPR